MKWIRIYNFLINGNEPQPLYSARSVELEGRRICIARLPKGYYACIDKCPHAGGQLGAGYCNENGQLVCPLHRYCFDLETGRGLQGDYIETFPVKEDESGVFVGFPDEKPWWKIWE